MGLTQANQVAIVPFEMDNDEGGSRTGYALGPQVPEPEALALLRVNGFFRGGISFLGPRTHHLV